MSRFGDVAERVARAVTAGPLKDASDASAAIVDGMEGVVSEQGEGALWGFWKKDVLDRFYKMGPRSTAQEAEALLADLVDGLEGMVSEEGEVPSRYWKPDALRRGQAALRALRAAGSGGTEAFEQGAEMFAKEMRSKGVTVEGPTKVIPGLRMNLWLGQDRYSSPAVLTVTLMGLLLPPRRWRVDVSGGVDGRSVSHKGREYTGEVSVRDVVGELRDAVKAAGLYRKLASKVAAQAPEWPKFELDALWADGLRLRTRFELGSGALKGGDFDSVNLEDMKDWVEHEAGNVFERMKPVLASFGLEIVSGSGSSTSMYNPSRSRVDYPFRAEVALKQTGLDRRKLEDELKDLLRR